jgi:hypothetical protein
MHQRLQVCCSGRIDDLDAGPTRRGLTAPTRKVQFVVIVPSGGGNGACGEVVDEDGKDEEESERPTEGREMTRGAVERMGNPWQLSQRRRVKGEPEGAGTRGEEQMGQFRLLHTNRTTRCSGH